MPLFGRAKTDDAATPAPDPTPVNQPGPPVDAPRDVDDYRDHLLSQVTSLRPFGIGLLEACGLTLCESITADIDLPVFTAATVYGWAVRASNLVGARPGHPVVLPLVGEVGADGTPGAPLSLGTTMRVLAGAPVPEGADAVVPVIDGEIVSDGVQFESEAAFHQGLWVAGSRVAEGDPLLSSGTVLDARMIAMLAELGLDKVLARPRPRVIVGTVGANLIDAGRPLAKLTQTYDAVTPMIAAAAEQEGAQTFAIGVLPQEPSALSRALSDQLVRADLFLLAAPLTDELTRALETLGTFETARVAMTPGDEVVFGLVGPDHVPLLVLPPNAVDAYVVYEVFGRSLVHALAGTDPLERAVVPLRVNKPLPVDHVRTQFVLGTKTSRRVTPLDMDAQAGGVELARANVIAQIRPGVAVSVGDEVSCWPLGE